MCIRDSIISVSNLSLSSNQGEGQVQILMELQNSRQLKVQDTMIKKNQNILAFSMVDISMLSLLNSTCMNHTSGPDGKPTRSHCYNIQNVGTLNAINVTIANNSNISRPMLHVLSLIHI
eukprot:TRINITY_DN16061_c0_g1_i1.p1 TRINITY_DN16061_c0_g1~~TRINITY_DN16061_c0_g1_i1.p1  ORF type:complete len:132 (+),score=13.64 TRINITY_DN16061_c0_g1_i1:40-396(+)